MPEPDADGGAPDPDGIGAVCSFDAEASPESPEALADPLAEALADAALSFAAEADAVALADAALAESACAVTVWSRAPQPASDSPTVSATAIPAIARRWARSMSGSLSVAPASPAPISGRVRAPDVGPITIRRCGVIPLVFRNLRIYRASVARFRISEAADLLGVSDDTLRRWAESGRLRVERDDGNRLSVDGAELAALAQELAVTRDPGTIQRESARNRMRGIVTRVVKDVVMAQVEIQAGPFRMVSLMSREAADELGLEPGVVAVASVKATQVVVEIPGQGGGQAAR